MGNPALGRVHITAEYVVDMNDERMVSQAKDALYDDVMNAVKYNELPQMIEVDKEDGLSVNDIPEFLLEDKDE